MTQPMLTDNVRSTLLAYTFTDPDTGLTTTLSSLLPGGIYLDRSVLQNRSNLLDAAGIYIVPFAVVAEVAMPQLVGMTQPSDYYQYWFDVYVYCDKRAGYAPLKKLRRWLRAALHGKPLADSYEANTALIVTMPGVGEGEEPSIDANMIVEHFAVPVLLKGDTS